MATITVLADMSTAPTAGVRSTPHAASTPRGQGDGEDIVAGGHQRFWTTFR
jgi:hypothetical protein